MVGKPGSVRHGHVPSPGFMARDRNAVELRASLSSHPGGVVEINEGALMLPAELVEVEEQFLLLGIAGLGSVKVEVATQESVALEGKGVEAEEVKSDLEIRQ